MKTVNFDIQASNAKGDNVSFTIGISHEKNGNHRFNAAIINSSEPLIWGEMPTGYYPSGEAVSKAAIESNTISFGAGEVERQGTNPFCVYLANSERNKKDRILFTLPVDRQGLIKMFS